MRSLALLFAVGLSLAASAHAQEPDCDTDPVAPGPREFTPAHNAMGVALNALVKVRYTAGFFEGPGSGLRAEDSIVLFRCEDGDFLCREGTPLPGRAQIVGDVLVLEPAAPLEARTRYGVIVAGLSTTRQFAFTTGVALDTRPPRLDRIVELTSSPVGERCEAPEGGYRIDVQIEPAEDDGPMIDVEYLVYLSRGPEVEAPELRARARQDTAGPPPLAFILQASEAVSPICVTVIAVDGVGNRDEDTPPACIDPIQGNFFAPLCAVTSPGLGAPGGLAAALPLLALGILCARRRRR